ncbi:MAG: signal peptidase I [Spirochaetales bacterium]
MEQKEQKFKKLNIHIDKKKLWNWSKIIITVALIIIAIYAVFNYVPYFADRQTLVIITNSMEPTINVGDVAIIKTNYNIEDLEVGDIIAFRVDINDDGEEEVIVHYIALIQSDGLGDYTIRTRREGVTEQINWDAWQIDQTKVVGTYDFRIPVIGKFLLFLSSFFGKMVAIINVLAIFFLISYFRNEKATVKK